MPTIVKPQPTVVGTNRDGVYADVKDLLSKAFHSDRNRRILRTSFHGEDNIVPYTNGLVHTVLRAWQQDLHLELRPDDVWLAILAQFSFFVKGNAEDVRRIFVSHEGQRELVIDIRPQTMGSVDVGVVAQQMAALIRTQLADQDLADWLLPEFSTTLPHDRSTAAMIFLGTMEQYFRYAVLKGCGFPSVTLHGERIDWANMVLRATRFSRFGDEAAAWSRCLVKALEYMVASFDKPDDVDVRDFWMRACHSAGANSSGALVTLSGWLTAFCWWRADGRKQRAYDDEELAGMWHLRKPETRWRLELDSVAFPVINRKEIPTAITRVPVVWRDDSGEEFNTFLLAGLTGMKLVDDEGTRVQPSSGWWMLAGDSAEYVKYMASRSERIGPIRKFSYRDVPDRPPGKI